MPWAESSVGEQKLMFVADCLRGEESMTALCERYGMSEAIIGENVALRQRDDGHWLIRFADVALGIIDRTSGQLVRFGAGRPPRSKASDQA